MVEDIFSGEGQIVNLIIGAILLLVIMAMAMIAFFYLSRKRITESELENANLQIEHQQEVLQSTLITQEAERKRIAQDLHDAISSKLNIVSLQANLLSEEAISAEETNTIGQSILKVTTNVLESSRQIAHALLPPTLEKFGLDAAIEELCDELDTTGAFEVKYQYLISDNLLTTEAELHLFRIAQELSNNAIKYAEANTISFRLTSEEDHISFRYEDDGKGMNVENAQLAKGLGMCGINNRVLILGGTVDFKSVLREGLIVHIKIPRSI